MVFANAAPVYLAAGWSGILPVPTATKFPPPTGSTGEQGVDPSPEQLSAWAGNGFAGHSVALRLPDGVVGIDVDQYVKAGKQKTGGTTLAAREADWGPLPATWSSTARGPGQPSRISFFRAAPGRYRSEIVPDIEVIQRHHRYAVVAPSPHADTGAEYAWYRPDGSAAGPGEVPRPDQLAALPAAWEAGLRGGAAEAGPASASYGAGEVLLAALTLDAREPCAETASAIADAARILADPDVGARHPAMTARVHRAVLMAAAGHAGFGDVLDELRDRWLALTAGEDREAEFDRMVLSSSRKAVTATGSVQVGQDPCAVLGGKRWADVPVSAAEPAPVAGAHVAAELVDGRPQPLDRRPATEDTEPLPLLPPVWRDPSWVEVIGTAAFDPNAYLDVPLADAMLARAANMVRRASDMKTAWLQQGAEQWELVGDLSGRIVKEVAALMPEGDPDPPPKGEKPSPAHRAYKRRVRMMENAGAAAVAASIKRATDGGRHPITVRVAELDLDPEILWAGRVPWDLRRSGEVPVQAAHVDPWGPHLKSAAVAPVPMKTPRWDAFLAAVWPDRDVRAWALRVLSISITGHADAALPVLFGPGGTGKTSVMHLLMALLGSYATAADPALLSERSNGFHVFDLKGARLAGIDEAMRESKSGVETLKQLTGGGMLKGSLKHQDSITFPSTHTLVLTSNTAPAVLDGALRRRVRLLPCEGDPDAVRAARRALTGLGWAQEAPGILALLMREAAAWLADPDSALTAQAPMQVQVLLGELVDEQDAIAQWLDDHVAPAEPGTRAQELYKGFRGWCRDRGMAETKIPTLTAWGRALSDRGYPATKRMDGKYRPLAVVAGGGYSSGGLSLPAPIALAEAEAPGMHSSPPPCTVDAQSTDQLCMPQNPRSAPDPTSDMHSMHSSSLYNSVGKTRESEKYGGLKGDSPEVCIEPSESAADQGEQGMHGSDPQLCMPTEPVALPGGRRAGASPVGEPATETATVPWNCMSPYAAPVCTTTIAPGTAFGREPDTAENAERSWRSSWCLPCLSAHRAATP